MSRQERDAFEALTDRQRDLLRLVFENRKSSEIAHLLSLSARYVDNQLIEAKNIIGATSRFEAARRFAAYEQGVGISHPVHFPPSPASIWPLALPIPGSKTPTNSMAWRQVALWGGIIAILTPIALTTAAMAIVALTFMLGVRPT